MNIRVASAGVFSILILIACTGGVIACSSSDDEPSGGTSSGSTSSGATSSSSSSGSEATDGGGSSSSSSSSSSGSADNTDGGDGNWCPTLKACCDRVADEKSKKDCTDAWKGMGADTNPKGADQGCKLVYGLQYVSMCK